MLFNVLMPLRKLRMGNSWFATEPHSRLFFNSSLLPFPFHIRTNLDWTSRAPKADVLLESHHIEKRPALTNNAVGRGAVKSFYSVHRRQYRRQVAGLLEIFSVASVGGDSGVIAVPRQDEMKSKPEVCRTGGRMASDQQLSGVTNGIECAPRKGLGREISDRNPVLFCAVRDAFFREFSRVYEPQIGSQGWRFYERCFIKAHSYVPCDGELFASRSAICDS